MSSLIIRDGDKVHAIRVEHIDFIEARGNHVQINAQGKGYLKGQRLADLEKQLDPMIFMRLHPSCVANITRLHEMDEDARGCWAMLKDGSRIPVSRSGRASLQRLIGATVKKSEF